MGLKRTPLYNNHLELKAKMVPFAGWEMPVHYSSMLAEHIAVRNKAGLFDVSHMGEILVSGSDAISFLEKLTCNLISTMNDGQVQYNAVLNDVGGIVDDITIYRISEKEFFIVSNASNYETVVEHMQAHRSGDVFVTNLSDTYAQIAFQGPFASKILQSLIPVKLQDLPYYHFLDCDVNNTTLRISRTGYTGEDGFEIYLPVSAAPALWNSLLEAGREEGVIPCGLGARDTLRLEARFPLYGHELDAVHTPVESGIGWIVKEKPVPFLGSEKILDQKRNGSDEVIVGFILNEAGIPREGYPVYSGEKRIGSVLSGGYSPILKQGIGTTRIAATHSSDPAIQIEIRSRRIEAKLHRGAFVKGSAGKK